MNGVIRFCLFVAVIAAIALGVYANNLNTKLENQTASTSTITTDRDSWKAKFEQQQTKSTQDAAALDQAQTQIKDLQAKLEEAQKPQPRTRARR